MDDFVDLQLWAEVSAPGSASFAAWIPFARADKCFLVSGFAGWREYVPCRHGKIACPRHRTDRPGRAWRGRSRSPRVSISRGREGRCRRQERCSMCCLSIVPFCREVLALRSRYQNKSFKERKILIHLPGMETFRIMPKWNEESLSCDLLIDGKPMELWQISQKAPGRFFSFMTIEYEYPYVTPLVSSSSLNFPLN